MRAYIYIYGPQSGGVPISSTAQLSRSILRLIWPTVASFTNTIDIRMFVYALLPMDPLSLATSVAGLASLALQIGPSLREYFSDVRDARKDVARYCNEIDGLFEVCKQLQDFLKTDTADAFKTTESVLCRTVVLCEGCLCELAKLLDVPREEGHSAAHWIKRMKWPIYKKQVEGIISRLARYTQLFQFALTVEGWCVPGWSSFPTQFG